MSDTRILDVADGPGLPVPGPHAVHVDGDYHRGLQDAAGYDQDAIDPTQPLRADCDLIHGAVTFVQAHLNQLLGALLLQYDICKERRAEHAAAVVQVARAQSALAWAEQAEGTALGKVPDDRPNLLAATLPGHQPFRPRGRSRWQLGLLLVVIGALEVVANYLAMLYLRDASWATWALASAAAAAILGGCYYLARSKSAAGAAALGCCVAMVILGSGVMRYRYAVDAISIGLLDAGQPALDLWTKLAILGFAIGLPATFGVITVFKARPDPAAAQAAVGAKAEADLVNGVRELREHTERCRLATQNAVAAESVASDARRNAEAGLTVLCDQAESVIDAEPGRRSERLAGYYRGLAHGAADPAMTARLDRRFAATVLHNTSVVGDAVEEARKQLAAVRAGLLSFPAPQVSGTRQDAP